MNTNATGNMQSLYGFSETQYIYYFEFLKEDGENLKTEVAKVEVYDPTLKNINPCTPRWLADEPLIREITDPLWSKQEWDDLVLEEIENKIPMSEFVELCYEDGITEMTEIVKKYAEFFE